MAHCLKSMPTQAGVGFFVRSCKPYNLSMQDFILAYDNATQYLVTNVSTYPGFDATTPFYLPIKLDPEILNGAYTSTVGRFYNYNRANFYGIALIAYWVLLVVFAGALNLARAIAPHKINSLNGHLSNTYRKYVTLAALGGTNVRTRGKLFSVLQFIIPTRVETVYLAGWFAMALAFMVSYFHHDSPNLFWDSHAQEFGRKVADRAGIMVLYLIPQLVLFAGRNNVLQWISGWPYSRFNVIHHWMARVSFLLMVVHAASMTIAIKDLSWYPSVTHEAFLHWGYVAITAAGIMCVHSLFVLRKTNYELFVLCHNVLGVLFVAGAWIHVEEEGFQQMMYATAAIWGFDKLLRILRLMWFGLATADVQLIAGETLKVSVPRPSSWKPYPLCFAYIYFFTPSSFWQSHPFTVIDSVFEEHVISFHIKVKGGLSSSLCQYLSRQPDQRAKLKCSVEGPYGVGASLHHYTAVSYLAGGNGIPGPFSSAVHLSRKGARQKLKLYWVIRHWKSIEWFYDELQSLDTTGVQVIVYVTQFFTTAEVPHSKSSSEKVISEHTLETEIFIPDSHSEQAPEIVPQQSNAHKDRYFQSSSRVMKKLPFIEFRAGRPDIDGIVKQDIRESSGAIAFVSCGLDQFVDATRKIVANSLEEGKRVDFYDTLEVW
ncbi:hypothetical protein JCM33374_g6486 [Metschnikowia sp. JCM 33374]|nr:hypothetical protein JCM33374_g6486 [Metschnikowia sp. JCM 33374]